MKVVNECTLDFEARSPIDLKARGLFVYTECLDTEITCLSVATNTDKPVLWIPKKFRKLINLGDLDYEVVGAKTIVAMVMDSGKAVAQNSIAEYQFWNEIQHRRLGWPLLPMEKLHDTMAQLAYHALPMNLAQGAEVLGLSEQKDKKGYAIMMKMCKPRKPLKAEKKEAPDWESKLWWHEKPEDFVTQFNYCAQDVNTTRLVHHSLAPLPHIEREIWLLDQKINLRGIKIDVPNVKAIIKVVKIQEAKQLKAFQAATDGAVSGPRSYVKLKEWVNDQAGLELGGVGKDIVDPLIKAGDLPPNVMKALLIKAELSKASVAKFAAMLNRMSSDGRVRGWSAYHAATTGRWAAWGLQLHNNPRDSYKPGDYDSVAELFRDQDIEFMKLLWDDPYFVASRCVRGSLIAAPGNVFYCSDFSAIEGRELASSAGEEWVLDAYRRGEDMYKHAAADLFGKPYASITKDERDIGKVEELFLGYEGGIGAFAQGAKSYGIDLEKLPALVLHRATEGELEGRYGANALARRYVSLNPDTMSFEAAVACDVIKRKWRAKRPKIVQFWKGLQKAAKKAIQNPGRVFSYREAKYTVNKGFLKCMMPSGRVMHYFDPKIGYMHYRGKVKGWVYHPETCECPKCDNEFSPSITYMGMRVVDGKSTRQWVRLQTHGGKLTENYIQGHTRDRLAFGMLNHEKAGYPIYMDVHDEDLTEVKQGFGSLEEFNRILEIKPDWALGTPIKAVGWEGTRYRK